MDYGLVTLVGPDNKPPALVVRLEGAEGPVRGASSIEAAEVVAKRWGYDSERVVDLGVERLYGSHFRRTLWFTACEPHGVDVCDLCWPRERRDAARPFVYVRGAENPPRF